ncbi:PD-(D/E)XK nuclease family protein [Vibrio astriarenae]
MYFVLMPDALSSRQCRQYLAEDGCVNVKVGTSVALFEQVAELWLLDFNTDASPEFDEAVRQAAYQVENAFWSKSLVVDEVTTVRELSDTLKHVYKQLPVTCDFESIPLGYFTSVGVDNRTNNYWNDLNVLCSKMGHIRPYEQQFIAQWLNEGKRHKPLSPFTVIVPQDMILEPWLHDAISRCNANNYLAVSHQKLSEIQRRIDSFYKQQSKNHALEQLSKGLFSPSEQEPSALSSDNLSIISARDELEECQVLISRLHAVLDKQPSSKSDIAVVLPKHSHHRQLLQSMMVDAGIAFSILSVASNEYQWDVLLLKELIELFLVKKQAQGYVADIQYASMLVNPLMPWSVAFGQKQYRLYLSNKDYLENAEYNQYIDDKYLSLLRLLFSPISHSANVVEWLESITPLLRVRGRYNQSSFIKQFDAIKLSISDIANNDEAIANISKHLDPQVVQTECENRWFLNSILLMSEQDMLIKPVEHLFVLGFNKGAFEVKPKVPGVFQLDQWRAISQAIVPTTETLHRLTSLPDFFSPLLKDEPAIERLKRLFSGANCGIHISLSEQSFVGDALQPSSTLFEMAILLQKETGIDPERLIKPVKHYPQAVPFLSYQAVSDEQCEALNETLPSALQLHKDLLAIHTDQQGVPRPESPTSLIRMMISPLAWLLDKQNIRSLAWEAEQCTPRIKGLVVHSVFEHHFDPDSTLNLESFDALFDHVIEKDAPFLNRSQWRLEKASLKSDTKRALTALVDWCDVDGWQSVTQEQKLTGEYFDLPIKGTVDAVFAKGDTKLILDYKTSRTSGISGRINAGYDIQTQLYTEMVKQTSEDNGGKYISGYYSSTEQKIVSNYPIESKSALLSNIEPKYIAGINSSTQKAEEAIKARISELRDGVVTLNQETDFPLWNKRGHTDFEKYWLEEKPLLKAHILKQQESGEQTHDQ